MKKTVEKIEGKLQELLKATTYDSDIKRLKEFQREISEKIRAIESKISVLEHDQTALMDVLNKKNEEIFQAMSEKADKISTNDAVNSLVEVDVSNFGCKQCDRIFNSMFHLSSHVKMDHQNQNKCKECEFEFKHSS